MLYWYLLRDPGQQNSLATGETVDNPPAAVAAAWTHRVATLIVEIPLCTSIFFAVLLSHI